MTPEQKKSNLKTGLILASVALAMNLRLENFRMVRKLVVVTAGMFAFGYALVPIYNAICEMTGINVLAI
eukprot:gene27599-49242_t